MHQLHQCEFNFQDEIIDRRQEKLQQFFNDQIFKIEKEEYAREEIEIDEFIQDEIFQVENDGALELIERKLGIFALLDEQCRFPKATDESLVEKLKTQHSKNSNLKFRVKRSAVEFTVVHYAGEVTYNASGFLEKNRDTVRTT